MAKGALGAGKGRGLLLPLLVLMTLLFILIACLSGYLFNRFIDGQDILGIDTEGEGVGNGAAFWMVLITLISSMLGLAACIMGYFHSVRYRHHSASGAEATAAISLLVNLLAFGIACKTLERSHLGGGKIGAITKCVAAFQIIVTFFHLIYNLLLHGMPIDDHHDTRTATPAGVGTTGMHTGVPVTKHHGTTDVV